MSQAEGLVNAGEGADADIARPRRLPRILVVVGFGLLFAYDTWEAVSTLTQLPLFYEAMGLPAAVVPWWLLIVGVALPAVAFVLALLAARRRPISQLVLLLAVALAVVAALSLGAVALESALRPGLLSL